MEKLGVIGCGNMGSAIMKGISASKLDVKVYAFDKDAEKLAKAPAEPCKNEADVVSECKYVLLAVKPQVLAQVLDALKSSVTEDTVFISICAGISEKFIREHTVPDAKVVLVMPNTPMMLGMGASAMSTDDRTTDKEFAFAKSVIESCGIAEIIPIDKMKEIICINGSSPAFIYLFAKGFVDYAAANGIDSSAALRLFAATLKGSAEMLTSSGMTVDQLIKQVSSPGGTTLAGLDKLYEGKLTDDVIAACDACTRRAYELAQ
ncbi:MAG: pyrroline-5-carboxylate reductase [Ruminiclostridium sp.]|nr:pyrroline-5-carboxylate reductase [Ruminiclostridium sp.]